MIVLDTNVVSELMKEKPDDDVIVWLDSQAAESVWTTSITVFELQMGMNLLPAGKRRNALEAAFKAFVHEDLENRVVAFDEAAAMEAARLAAKRRVAGRPGEFRDTQIAGIVLARKAELATRNTKHFADLGGHLINPWDA